MLLDNRRSTHRKLYGTVRRVASLSKVDGIPNLSDAGVRLRFLQSVDRRLVQLYDRITKILDNEDFVVILRHTNFRKIINSLNLALCTHKEGYAEKVFNDFELWLQFADRQAIDPSPWSFGTYDYSNFVEI